jgi:hypothetical protein
MCGRLLLAALLVAIVPLAAHGSDELLASYEPSETNLTVGSPDNCTITRPPQGGDVPSATEGSYVLKLDCEGETDRKVEVKHEWSGRIFNLAGYGGLLADVYIETPSALPQIMGVWDSVFGWLEGFGLPTATGQWVTVSMCVYDKDHIDLDEITALVLEDLGADDVVLYLDNLRLVPPRQVSFATHEWIVKCGSWLGPGLNGFSQSEDHIWVDSSGHLHLKIVNHRTLWWCTELILNESYGYGTYVFTVESRVDFDENIVLGLFTWDSDAPEHNYREIDFEFGRWGDPDDDNAQFVVQPWDAQGNRHRFDIGYDGPTETTTHVMTWRPDRIEFKSYYGDFRFSPPAENMIEYWTYEGSDNPPPGAENVRINFWLADVDDPPDHAGNPPVNGQEAEVVITDFRYLGESYDIPAAGNLGLLLGIAMLMGTAGFLLWRRKPNLPR